jgi:exopolysaccharide production protein ExoZ
MLVQLQYLRAIAALLVVYFHSVLQVTKVNDGFDWQFRLFGETGVDIFFVLSGFVMWLTTAGRHISPLEFYRRRIKRIVSRSWRRPS